jgi:uncharacterized membrane protein
MPIINTAAILFCFPANYTFWIVYDLIKHYCSITHQSIAVSLLTEQGQTFQPPWLYTMLKIETCITARLQTGILKVISFSLNHLNSYDDSNQPDYPK